MKGLALANNTITKYFRVLKNFNKESKEELVKMLNESIKEEKTSNINFKTLYGSWIDDKEADEIIKDIRDSRVNKIDSEKF